MYDGYINNFINGNISTMVSDNWMKHDEEVANFLMHHGTKGQKWGVRKYQNNDGSLTALGRVHYGVGAARNVAGKVGSALGSGAGKVGSALGSGAGKVGTAIRKKVAPNEDDINEKYEKAKAKEERQRKIDYINKMNGKKKKLKDMSDQEIIDAINRHRNERILKEMERTKNKSNLELALRDKVREGIANAAGSTMKDIGINIGKHVSNALDTKENKAKRKEDISRSEVNELENKQKYEKLEKGEDDNSLKKQAEAAKNAADIAKSKANAYSDELKARAATGDNDALNLINQMSNANKGKWEKQPDRQDVSDFLRRQSEIQERITARPSLSAPGQSTASQSSNSSQNGNNSGKKNKNKNKNKK